MQHGGNGSTALEKRSLEQTSMPRRWAWIWYQSVLLSCLLALRNTDWEAWVESIAGKTTMQLVCIYNSIRFKVKKQVTNEKIAHCIASYVIQYVPVNGSLPEYQDQRTRCMLEASAYLILIPWIWYMSTNSSRNIFLYLKDLLSAFLCRNAGIDSWCVSHTSGSKSVS